MKIHLKQSNIKYNNNDIVELLIAFRYMYTT